MPRLLTAAVLTLAALLPLPLAADQTACPEDFARLVTTAFPEAIQIEDGFRVGARTVRTPRGHFQEPTAPICRRWPAQPQILLVAMPLIHDGPDPQGYDHAGDLELLLFDHDTLALQSRLTLPRFILDDAISLRDLRFDTAPYRLVDQRLSFGIRAAYANMSQPNPFSEEVLWLFDPRGETLVPVLEKLVVESHGGEWDTRCAGEFHDLSRILDLAPNGTNGAADIRLITTRSKVLAFEKNGDCEDITETSTETQIIRYDGTRYPVDPDTYD
ncbi:hypothetical protein JJJ17_07595 [Paracoccus caeni]|uniref:Uncharacterized protein n=1 Tax=Paracoccus caeni TaxID=657651 RepID=A0A934SEA4_9RHOB|nr:hypothetical protein [Paracoccus caeni]MBK4215784.1 hypothetical protein [Paracoccus caeni]